LEKKDIRQIAQIKNFVFSNFNKSDYFKKSAITRYLNYTNLNKSNQELIEAFHISKNCIFYIAEENNKIIGYIKGEKNKIGNLFILGKEHKKGTGKKLVDLFEKEAKNKILQKLKFTLQFMQPTFTKKWVIKKQLGLEIIMD